MPEPTLHPVNTDPEQVDEKLGFEHENLEGWIPALASESEIREALEKAFDYRGDLTITLKNGEKLEGYLFDRRNDGTTLDECYARMIPKGRREKIRIAYSDVAALAFSGKDTAAGKTFAAWVKKYHEKKAAGEKNIGIDSESLDEE
jgi:hypothetical protein